MTPFDRCDDSIAKITGDHMKTSPNSYVVPRKNGCYLRLFKVLIFFLPIDYLIDPSSPVCGIPGQAWSSKRCFGR